MSNNISIGKFSYQDLISCINTGPRVTRRWTERTPSLKVLVARVICFVKHFFSAPYLTNQRIFEQIKAVKLANIQDPEMLSCIHKLIDLLKNEVDLGSRIDQNKLLELEANLETSRQTALYDKVITQQKTLPKECERGSYIFTQFHNLLTVKEGEREDDHNNACLHESLVSYGRDWINRPCSTLRIGDIEFIGGCDQTPEQNSEWVKALVNQYSDHLLRHPKLVAEEIQKMNDCPLIKFVTKGGTNFQTAFKQCIEEEKKNLTDERQKEALDCLYQNCSCTERRLAYLAQLSKQKREDIASLFYVRTFYVMCCLSQASLVTITKIQSQSPHFQPPKEAPKQLPSLILARELDSLFTLNPEGRMIISLTRKIKKTKPDSSSQEIGEIHSVMTVGALNGKDVSYQHTVSVLKGTDSQNKALLAEAFKPRPKKPNKPSPKTPGQKILNVADPALRAVTTAAQAVTLPVIAAVNNVNPIKESEDPNNFRWKIDRYEALIKQTQDLFGKLLPLPIEGSDIWQSLRDYCKFEIKKDGGRFTQKYLGEIRTQYTQGIEALRKMASSKPTEENKAIISRMCYLLYTQIDLNDLCHSVIEEFEKLAPVPSSSKDGKLSLLQEIIETHKKIESVPQDAKVPLLSSWGNSLVGSIGGLPFVPFDPNTQSNPIHEIYAVRATHQTASPQVMSHIAMGTPTIETSTGPVEIALEFRLFLEYCKANGLTHLYINCQNFIEKASRFGNEAQRCQALQQLEKEFPNTFYFVTLSQDSPFYRQEYQPHTSKTLRIDTAWEDLKSKLPKNIRDSAYMTWFPLTRDKILFKDADEQERTLVQFYKALHQELKSTTPKGGITPSTYSYYALKEEFQDELISQIFDHNPELISQHSPRASKKGWAATAVGQMANSVYEGGKDYFTRSNEEVTGGNFVSYSLRSDGSLRKWSQEAISEICKLFPHDFMSQEEKKIAIRLFYLVFSKKVMLMSKCDSYNISCKDRIDRGAASSAEEFLYHMVLEGQTESVKALEFLKDILFARAIIVRKRSINKNRLERMMQTSQFMLTHQEEIKILSSKLFEGISFKNSALTDSSVGS